MDNGQRWLDSVGSSSSSEWRELGLIPLLPPLLLLLPPLLPLLLPLLLPRISTSARPTQSRLGLGQAQERSVRCGTAALALLPEATPTNK